MNSSQVGFSGQGSTIVTESLNYDICTLVIIILFYGILISTSGIIVRLSLKYANIDVDEEEENDEEESKSDTGTAIGKVENVLVLTLMLIEAYTALGVIFAAKSIVRKSDMDNEDTSYYLTGTITNFTYSVVIGFLLHTILWMVMQKNLL